jgi:hypothetical protein
MTREEPTPGKGDEPGLPDAHGVDPMDFLRAMLAISPEDAASAREDAAEAMKPAEPTTREQ